MKATSDLKAISIDESEMSAIVMAFKRLETVNRDWLKAIENRRSGSHWGGFMPWQCLAGLPWQRLADSERIEGLHSPECDYYFAYDCLPFEAVEHIKLLSDFETFDWIIIAEADHGTELVAFNMEAVPTNEAWLILGPDKDYPDKKIVRTCYPGRFAISPTQHPAWDGTRECFQVIADSGFPVAVKGVNDPVLKDKILQPYIK
jgi:hypothetical protein